MVGAGASLHTEYVRECALPMPNNVIDMFNFFQLKYGTFGHRSHLFFLSELNNLFSLCARLERVRAHSVRSITKKDPVLVISQKV